ncbi:MAG TPA: 2-phosphosulfolactate phosphatase [Pirellulales bacterium]|jgi:2-phosphosulfolactate phosphatase|nr:2-phosphosulfolactate phosphatase [Pirellulales bacterium]
MTSIRVHLLPDLVADGALAGATVVVIDCLRATTTIAYALAAGAREVIPCLEVDEARQRAAAFGKGEALLGGERQGVRIEGFDLGNSPTEYTPAAVGGRTIVFTTTNGTRAMMRCRGAKHVLLGSLVNRAAVAEALRGEANIHIVCAGTRGEISREDVLTAGAIAAPLVGDRSGWQWNDETALALDAWHSAERQGLVAALHDSQGGRNLMAEGFEHDIATAARLDTISLAPQLDVRAWTIRA